MFAYVIRRLLISIVILFFASILVFVLVSTAGDPLALLRANPHTPHSTIVAREHLLHLNDPLWQRYWIWFSNAIHGNLGNTTKGQAVAPQLWSHLFVTLRMVIVATILAIVIAIGSRRVVRRPAEQADRPRDHRDELRAAGHAGLRPRTGAEGVRGHPHQPARGVDHLLHRRRAEPDAQRLLLQPITRLRRSHRAAGPDAHSGHLHVLGHLPALVDDRDARRRPRPAGPGQGVEPAAGARPSRPAQRADPRSRPSSLWTSPPYSVGPSSPSTSSAGRGSARGTSPASPPSTSTSCWPICC